MYSIAILSFVCGDALSNAAPSSGPSHKSVPVAIKRYRDAVSLALNSDGQSNASLSRHSIHLDGQSNASLSQHSIHLAGVSAFKVSPLPPQLSTYTKWFDKFIPVFGMPVLGGLEVPDWRVEHAANIFAQYLDWDADGKPNNEKVHQALMQGGTIIGLFPHGTPASFDPQEEKDEFHDAIVRKLMVPAWVKENTKTRIKDKRKLMNLLHVDMKDVPQTVYIIRVPLNAITLMRKASSGPTSFVAEKDDRIFDGAIEEILHVIFDVGYGQVYPHVFSPENDSLIAQRMVETIGDCGYAFNHTFKYPHCHGHWHYDDETCGFGCLISEYTFRSLITLLGGFDGSHNDVRGDACRDMQDEWALCTADELRKYEPHVVELYDVYGRNPYGVPAVLPDGNYRPKYWPKMSLAKRYQSKESQRAKVLFFYEQLHKYRTIMIVFGSVVAGFLLSRCVKMSSKRYRGRVRT